MKHIKTPTYHDGRWLAEANKALLAEIVTEGLRTRQEAEEATAEIVRAVNAYDDLLAMCETWLEVIQNSLALRLALAGLPENAGQALVEMLQNALALARAEGEAGQ